VDQTDGGHWGPCLGCKVDVQEIPTVLEFSAGSLGLYGALHFHDEASPSYHLTWMFSENCILKLQQNFTVRCRI
jgi:hypothetical protein